MPCGESGKDHMLPGSRGDVSRTIVHLQAVPAAGDSQQGGRYRCKCLYPHITSTSVIILIFNFIELALAIH